MSNKTGPLDVAFCPDCSASYTRKQLADAIYPARRAFRCSCGFEWNGEPWRPLTIQEMLDGRSSGRYVDIDVSVIVRCVAGRVQAWKE